MDPQDSPSSFQPDSGKSFLDYIKSDFAALYRRLPTWSFSLLIALVIFVLFVVASNDKTVTLKPTYKEPDYLAVTGYSPMEKTDTTRPNIYIKFNLPVSAHHAKEFFFISPNIDGTLEQENSYEIVYKPNQEVKPGTNISFMIKSGLQSESGKKLVNDFQRSFVVRTEFTGVEFANGNWTGKFMSFASHKGADITFKVGGAYNPRVVVYEANIDAMLKSITYQENNDQIYGGYSYETYNESVIDTSKMKKIIEYEGVEDGQKINFKEKTGIYLFQGIDDRGVPNNAWIALNETGIHFRQDDKNVFLAAQNLTTLEPESGISVSFYQLGNTPKVLAQHSLSGIQEYPFAFGQRLDLIVAKRGDDTMIIPVKVPNSQAEIQSNTDLSQREQIFVYTDRPVYKRGAKVSFRGIIRNDNDGVYLPSTISKLHVSTGFGGESWKLEQDVQVLPGGIFYGEFTLPQDVKDGTYYVNVTTLEGVRKKQSYGDIKYDVFEYKKPSYELSVSVDKSDYIKPDIIKATFKGTFFAGKPLSNEKVKLTIYSKDYFETEKAVYNSAFNISSWGGMCGGGGDFEDYYGSIVGTPQEIILDGNGTAQLEFSTRQLESLISQEVTFIIEKTDQNGNRLVGVRNAIVHQGSFNVFIRPGPSRVALGEEVLLSFYAEDLSGQKLSGKEFVYQIYQETWNGQESDKKQIKLGTLKTDENGNGVLKETITEADETSYVFVSIVTQDNNGNTVEARKNILVYKKDVKSNDYPWWEFSGIDQTVLKISSPKNSFMVGEHTSLEIVAPEDMRIFGSFERGRVYNPQWVTLKKGINTFEFDIPNNYSPSITPTFSFFYNGQYYIEGLSLNVPAMHKLIVVDVTADKEKYSLGDTALLTITTKDNKGNLISSDVSVGIVDKAIFALRENASNPLHSSFYFYRSRSTNSSSSLSWIATYPGGGRGGGGGYEALMKDSDTLYWNPNLKTGSDGQVKVEVPVGQTQTTWQALVYASTNDTKLGQGTKDFIVAR